MVVSSKRDKLCLHRKGLFALHSIEGTLYSLYVFCYSNVQILALQYTMQTWTVPALRAEGEWTGSE